MKKLLAIALLLLMCAFLVPGDRYFAIAKNLEIFSALYKEVNAVYVDEINPNTLMRSGIDTMLYSLDPYTNYISENQIEDYRIQNTGQYAGIGAALQKFGQRLVITMVYENFSSYKSGLRIGDELLQMDGKDISKMPLEEAEQFMHGQIGKPVQLLVKRQGAADPIALSFKREKIKVTCVPYSGMLKSQAGYVKLTEFSADAGREVKEAVESLLKEGAKNIILDLRNNHGGLVMEAVNICNLFIPKQKIVVSTKGKWKENNINYTTQNAPFNLEIPVVILINKASASASEIVAGTLQDYDRAVIVGEKSFGKGLVQSTRPLSQANSQVKVTTAKYYTPTGRCIQKLDYAHRQRDGKVLSMADSLKKTFKTTTGRTVYDNGGIDPDVSINSPALSAFVTALEQEGHLLDFASYYASKHPTIAAAKKFELSSTDYDEFVQWMSTRKFDYDNPIEKELKKLEEEIKSCPEFRPYMEKLKTQSQKSRSQEWQMQAPLLKTMLEQQICCHYYFEKGMVESSLKNDTYVGKAVEILSSGRFSRLLNR